MPFNTLSAVSLDAETSAALTRFGIALNPTDVRGITKGTDGSTTIQLEEGRFVAGKRELIVRPVVREGGVHHEVTFRNSMTNFGAEVTREFTLDDTGASNHRATQVSPELGGGSRTRTAVVSFDKGGLLAKIQTAGFDRQRLKEFGPQQDGTIWQAGKSTFQWEVLKKMDNTIWAQTDVHALTDLAPTGSRHIFGVKDAPFDPRKYLNAVIETTRPGL